MRGRRYRRAKALVGAGGSSTMCASARNLEKICHDSLRGRPAPGSRALDHFALPIGKLNNGHVSHPGGPCQRIALSDLEQAD